ncbi:nucleotide disphospho-sugar-binding domain-containing protein [Actinomadura sp. 3N407]|uniref:nucleotide disphospho-sugar-binding domain-containing protein n=1 Tax=Actinomadura sp. 3N407 TaxID=3457423 RepID=UPI003FCDB802
MRVLFTLPAVTTHLYMMAPLAWAFRTSGNEVRVASHQDLTQATVGVGLPAVEVGGGHGRPRTLHSGNVRPDGEWSGSAFPGKERDQVFAPWVGASAAMAPDLLRFAERWRPDLVVTDPFLFAAPLVAARLCVPLVRCVWGPDIMRRVSHPMQGPVDDDVREPWPAGLVELFEEHGVEIRNDHPVGTVDPWPGSLQFPGTPGRIPMRFVPYNGAAVAPDWVLERPARRRVCVTWGRAVAGDGALPRVVAALAGMDVDLVLAIAPAEREALGELPKNARVAEGLPLHLLMPSCDAIVNQAGSSTLLTAACAGVPQVLMPKTSDAPFHATSFGASGGAVVLDAHNATADDIGSAVTRALTDAAVRAAADKLRHEIVSTPPPSDVVRTLEALI